MANHSIPRAAECIEELTALADDGRVAHLKAYRHVRSGHTRPEFYVLWYAEQVGGRMDRRTRVTQQFSGARAKVRLDAELTAARKMFAKARARNGEPS